MNVQGVTAKVPTGAARPRLKIAIGTYGHTAAIKDGSVPIEGVDSDMIEVKPIIQAFRRMVPPLVNEGVTLIKDSSLVSAIGLAELALAARTVAGAYSRYWEPYLAISAVYLVLTLTLSLLAKRLEAPAHHH